MNDFEMTFLEIDFESLWLSFFLFFKKVSQFPSSFLNIFWLLLQVLIFSIQFDDCEHLNFDYFFLFCFAEYFLKILSGCINLAEIEY